MDMQTWQNSSVHKENCLEYFNDRCARNGFTGASIGVQKPVYLPDRHVYEYTPETFPWFYDKAHWIKYLDSMVENWMNSLYLWNGHPFAAYCKLIAIGFGIKHGALRMEC